MYIIIIIYIYIVYTVYVTYIYKTTLCIRSRANLLWTFQRGVTTATSSTVNIYWRASKICFGIPLGGGAGWEFGGWKVRASSFMHRGFIGWWFPPTAKPRSLRGIRGINQGSLMIPERVQHVLYSSWRIFYISPASQPPFKKWWFLLEEEKTYYKKWWVVNQPIQKAAGLPG